MIDITRLELDRLCVPLKNKFLFTQFTSLYFAFLFEMGEFFVIVGHRPIIALNLKL